VPAKGEILTIQCDDLPEEFILLSGIFLIPMGNKKFRAGSTYEWNFPHELPTDEGKLKLLKLLDEFLKLPYSVIDHRAGVRPTVKDRRPLIGSHPEHENVFLFNGMGTKGVQLIPYFADHFVGVLEKGKTLSGEVDVRRFFGK
jgi:glycine/D-amino acid oxidase-like deaminating enzyme